MVRWQCWVVVFVRVMMKMIESLYQYLADNISSYQHYSNVSRCGWLLLVIKVIVRLEW